MVNVDYIRFSAFQYAHHIMNKENGYNIFNARRIFKKYFFFVKYYIDMLDKLYDDNILRTYQNMSVTLILQIGSRVKDIRTGLNKLANTNINVLDVLKIKQANRILDNLDEWLAGKYVYNEYEGLRYRDYDDLTKINKITQKILNDLNKEE